MKRLLLSFAALAASMFVAVAEEPNNDPLKWSNGKTTAKLGGFVHLVTSVDFGGAVDNEDFIPSYTAVQDKWSNENNFQITPSYSQLNFGVVHHTDKIGDIKAYFEVDFRGTGNTIRLRHAYVTAMGFLLGQTNSLSVDINAAAMTIDIQGVNSRALVRTPMVAYHHTFDRGFSIGTSLEMPQNLIFTNQLLNISNLSAEVSELTTYIGSATQKAPDVMLYLQNKGKAGHIRLLGIYRNLSYHDLVTSSVESVNGYGVQLGSSLNLSPRFTLYGQGVYGVGIARYINDLARILTDMVPNVDNLGEMDALPMWGGSAGVKAVLSDRVYMTSSYSRAVLDRVAGYDLDVLYHKGDYVSSTLFYSPFRNATFAIEYLFGSHVTMDSSYGQANRIQVMAKYAF